MVLSDERKGSEEPGFKMDSKPDAWVLVDAYTLSQREKRSNKLLRKKFRRKRSKLS
jgi:hypothetical protein